MNILEDLRSNSYPGRGIMLGLTPDGKNAAAAYFIMGRSENSRNRVFVEDGDGIRTKAYDPSKMKDPSLIIYAPVRVLGSSTIVTNGDQTDTIYEGLEKGLEFNAALRTREFEPDAPNYTPRISGMMTVQDGAYCYKLSILKSAHGCPDSCERFTYEYDAPLKGEAHFIHTYRQDGDPLPSFEGDPKTIELDDAANDIDTFTEALWDALNADNKVSLFVRYINIADGTWQTRIVNRHEN